MKAFMKKKFFGYRSVSVYLIVAMVIVMVVGERALAADDKPKLTRGERKVVHEAQEAMTAKQYSNAQKILSDFIEASDDKVHYLVEFSLGNAWALDNQSDKALPHYQTAAALYASDAAVWQNLGKAYYELARYGEAGDCLIKANALASPPSSTMVYQAAVAYIQAKRPKDARSLLEKIVNGKDGSQPDPAWLEALLKVYIDLDQKDKALGLTRKLISKKGQDPRLWQMLTHLYIERKAYNKAAAALEIKTSLADPSREEIERLGDLYRMAGVPLKAARQYEKLIGDAYSPKNVEKTASAYLAARRLDTAIDILKRGVDRKPTFRLWWMLAGALYECEDFTEAMHAFDECSRRNPKHAQAYLMKGYCALRLELLTDAEAAFTKAADFPKQRAEAEQRLEELVRYRSSNPIMGPTS